MEMFINKKGTKNIHMKTRMSSGGGFMRSRKWLMLLFAAALTLLILGLFLFSKSRREGAGEAQFTDLSMREVSGITVEERLKSHDIDPSSARITKITNPDALKEQYNPNL